MAEAHEIAYFNTSTNGLNEGTQRDIAINLNPPRQNPEVLTSNCNRSTVPGVTVWLRKHEGLNIDTLHTQLRPDSTITDKGDIVEITMPNVLYSVSFGGVAFTQEESKIRFSQGHKRVIRIEGNGGETRQNMNYQWMESK